MPPIASDQTGFWKPPDSWTAEQRPKALWPWIVHAGSLTEKLRATVGDTFHVQVVHEGNAQLNDEDARLLQVTPSSMTRVREVYLCGDIPWVFARTLAPAEGGRWLDKLGTQPLGERVFAEAGTHRTPIEAARLDETQPLYQAAIKGMARRPEFLWARRSVLTVRGGRLLIYECFLSGTGN
ncbi:MAG: chorismate lyase [Gammaproteobacteria bacterium]